MKKLTQIKKKLTPTKNLENVTDNQKMHKIHQNKGVL